MRLAIHLHDNGILGSWKRKQVSKCKLRLRVNYINISENIDLVHMRIIFGRHVCVLESSKTKGKTFLFLVHC